MCIDNIAVSRSCAMRHPYAGGGFDEWLERGHQTARGTADDDPSVGCAIVSERFAIREHDDALTAAETAEPCLQRLGCPDEVRARFTRFNHAASRRRSLPPVR